MNKNKNKPTLNWLEIRFILAVFKNIFKGFSKLDYFCFCIQQILPYLFNNLLKPCKYMFSFITPGITWGLFSNSKWKYTQHWQRQHHTAHQTRILEAVKFFGGVSFNILVFRA